MFNSTTTPRPSDTAIGVDPDTTHIGLAVVGPNGYVLGADLVGCVDAGAVVERRIHDLLTRAVPLVVEDLKVQASRICVEGQMRIPLLQNGKINPRAKVDPQDLIHLAQVAGGCFSALRARYPEARFFFPFPSEWKGTIKKEIFTRRTMHVMKLTSCARTNCLLQDGRVISRPFPLRMHTHIIDAIALGRWAQLHA